MRNFNRLHSYTTGEFFYTWLSEDGRFAIQKEIGDGYGLFPWTPGEYMSQIRNASMRECLETYYKIMRNEKNR